MLRRFHSGMESSSSTSSPGLVTVTAAISPTSSGCDDEESPTIVDFLQRISHFQSYCGRCRALVMLDVRDFEAFPATMVRNAAMAATTSAVWSLCTAWP